MSTSIVSTCKLHCTPLISDPFKQAEVSLYFPFFVMQKYSLHDTFVKTVVKIIIM